MAALMGILLSKTFFHGKNKLFLFFTYAFCWVSPWGGV
jgi:hypothetical protein